MNWTADLAEFQHLFGHFNVSIKVSVWSWKGKHEWNKTWAYLLKVVEAQEAHQCPNENTDRRGSKDLRQVAKWKIQSALLAWLLWHNQQAKSRLKQNHSTARQKTICSTSIKDRKSGILNWHYFTSCFESAKYLEQLHSPNSLPEQQVWSAAMAILRSIHCNQSRSRRVGRAKARTWEESLWIHIS